MRQLGGRACNLQQKREACHNERGEERLCVRCAGGHRDVRRSEPRGGRHPLL